MLWTYYSETGAQDEAASHLEKLDEAGELVWSQTYAVVVKRHHVARGVAVDAAHNVYWLIWHDATGSQHVYLAKYTL